ncbi:hypothetical protein [Niallia sp. FSL W8-0954]|uniref:hypothetical protein n=1 Tax=Niallia sp. FSL W8-0954 TaxID=2975338 RepID=UPI0030FA2EE2
MRLKRLVLKNYTTWFRHSHATILVASKKKIPVKTIAERLGNTPKMIYEVYGHNYDELERESVEAFEQALNS